MSNPDAGTDVRYCIHCGHEIGRATHCTNPDCGMPNFYRDVSRREPRRPDSTSTPPTDQELRRRQRAESTTPRATFHDSGRHTIPMRLQPVASLRRSSAPHEEYSIYSGTTTIGARPPAKIIIDHPEISSVHATIDCVRDTESNQESEDAWTMTLHDQGSTNGTYVNDEAVEQTKLKAGDRIRFASLEYEIRLISANESKPANE